VRRAHVIAWRKILEKQKLAPATVRRKMSALSDLFNYLCDKNAIADNPVHGVERPKEGANQGKTPAISDAQAAALLDAPSPQTLKGKRDRAILAVLLFHAVRRAELCALRVKDYAERQGVKHFCIHGKGSKIRYLPVNPAAARRIEEYIDAAGIRDNPSGPLFRVATANKMGPKLSPDSVYRNVVRYYGKRLGISIDGLTGPVSRITTLFLKFVCSDFNGRNTKARS
jgi:site-specific recombinase XerD